MICPYCKTNVPDGIQFCSKCGQPIANSSGNTDNTSKYWKDVDKLNNANENNRLAIIREVETENKKKRAAASRKVIICLLIVVALSMATYSLYKFNQKRLDGVKASAIGHSYTDTSGSSIVRDGDKRTQITVTIKDENTLTYTYGSYTSKFIPVKGGFTSIWSENEIYEECDYNYSFSSSLFGTIWLKFNGKRYKVTVDDGVIYNIIFYDDKGKRI